MLKASPSWRGNDIIRERIPRINDTVIKKLPSLFEMKCCLSSFMLLPLVLRTAERLKNMSESIATRLLSIL